MQSQDLFQYGWIGYGFVVSFLLFTLVWAIVPAKIVIRLTKAEGKSRRMQFWIAYLIGAVGFLALAGLGVSLALQQMFL